MTAVDPPYSLLAELTHACPLQCAYCSNPIELQARELELTTSDWKRVITEAAKLGVLQIHFSGGEPLMRQDLEDVVAWANQNELYSNLITSGIGLTKKRIQALTQAGINSIQISLQDSDDDSMAPVVGSKFLQPKLNACSLVRESNIPLSINIVIHKHNIERLESMVLQAVQHGASRIEIANVQYYGWAFLNRNFLMPSKDQVLLAQDLVVRLRSRFAHIEIIYVRCDYLEDEPKPCMGGWGRLHLTVDPTGLALPCPAARVIKTLKHPSVNDFSLFDIWFNSDSFNAYRGDSWMMEPCKSCDRKNIDFGGCRCQAYLYTANAHSTDPVCQFSDMRQQVDQVLLDSKQQSQPILRTLSQPV